MVQADDPSHIEDSFTANISLTNGLGQAYDIEGVWFKANAASPTNIVTLSVINSQDVDLTGTNVTAGAITYPIKTWTYSGNTDWTPDELIRVPAGAVLYLANAATVTVTNNFVLFRDYSQD